MCPCPTWPTNGVIGIAYIYIYYGLLKFTTILQRFYNRNYDAIRRLESWLYYDSTVIPIRKLALLRRKIVKKVECQVGQLGLENYFFSEDGEINFKNHQLFL